MSPTDAGRFTGPATVTHPAGPSIPTLPGEGHAHVQDGSASGGAPAATYPGPSRPVTAPRVGPSGTVHQYPCNDPCNYLG
jgi:hypothetical protein